MRSVPFSSYCCKLMALCFSKWGGFQSVMTSEYSGMMKSALVDHNIYEGAETFLRLYQRVSMLQLLNRCHREPSRTVVSKQCSSGFWNGEPTHALASLRSPSRYGYTTFNIHCLLQPNQALRFRLSLTGWASPVCLDVCSALTLAPNQDERQREVVSPR